MAETWRNRKQRTHRMLERGRMRERERERERRGRDGGGRWTETES